jgi:hypothetical protein
MIESVGCEEFGVDSLFDAALVLSLVAAVGKRTDVTIMCGTWYVAWSTVMAFTRDGRSVMALPERTLSFVSRSG